MLIDLLTHLGQQIQQRNSYFQRHTPIAVKLKNGKVVKYTTNGEFEYCGISDTGYREFYIRIDPNIVQARSPRQFSSMSNWNDVTVNLALVAFNFSDLKFNGITMLEKLMQDMGTIDWYAVYRGSGISLQVQGGTFQEHDIFEAEMGQKFEGGSTNYSAVAIRGQLKYTVRRDTCIADCDALKPYCI